MNFTTNFLHILSSGAIAYLHASQARDPLTRPNLLAMFQLSESGSVPFLEVLSKRAIAEGDQWLGEKLAAHAKDEKKHEKIFAQELKQLGLQAINLDSEERSKAFYGEYYKGYTKKNIEPEHIDWIVFIASTYAMEEAASKDLVRMANILPENDKKNPNLKKSLALIAADETRHAAYLKDALHRKVSPQTAQAIISEWQTRKVNAIFALVWSLVEKKGSLPPLVEKYVEN